MGRFQAKAITNSHPKRIMYIFQDPASGDNKTVRGWNFVVSELQGNGSEEPLGDVWVNTFKEILAYPGEYSSERLVWKDEYGNVVDIQSLDLI